TIAAHECERKIEKALGTAHAYSGRNRARWTTESAIGDDHLCGRGDLRRLCESEFHELRITEGRFDPARGVRATVQGLERISFAARADQQRRRGSGAKSKRRQGSGQSFHRASSQGARVSHRVRDLADGWNVSEQPFVGRSEKFGRRAAAV